MVYERGNSPSLERAALQQGELMLRAHSFKIHARPHPRNMISHDLNRPRARSIFSEIHITAEFRKINVSIIQVEPKI
jgi:hypothetical protein